MLDAAHFHAIASATLMHIHDQLEQAFDSGDLEDLDYDQGAGILSIVTAGGASFILNRHEAARQLWLASRFSGGLHFDFSQDAQEWALPDGRRLKDILAEDLRQCGIRVSF